MPAGFVPSTIHHTCPAMHSGAMATRQPTIVRSRPAMRSYAGVTSPDRHPGTRAGGRQRLRRPSFGRRARTAYLLLIALSPVCPAETSAPAGATAAAAATAAIDSIATEAEALLGQIRAADLDPHHALDATGVRLDTSFAALHLESGVLIPVRAAGGRLVEMVFVGRGLVRLDPPDEIEAGQLELFTGGTRLAEIFTEAVFVIARDQAADALLRRPAATTDTETLRRAGERYTAWKNSPERRTLGVETGILLDALKDPLYEDYFAGWFMGRQLGPFLLQMDPAAEEQINLGQFVRFDATPEEKHSLSRFLHRQQRRGRLVGLEVEDLGRWDSWVQTAVRDANGVPRPGSEGFEPRHYQIEVSVDPRTGHLASRSRVALRVISGRRRVVRLELHADLEITRVAIAAESRRPANDDSELFYLREGSDLQVFLPRVPAAGTEVELEVTCEGSFLERGNDRDWALRDALGWYPRTGANERATYDVTLRWPRRYRLLASGVRVDGGKSHSGNWERRHMAVPTLGFSFEVGLFEVRSESVGDIRLNVAFDPGTRELAPKTSPDELMSTVADALRYYQEIFGPYPLDELTVVTVPRQYSQAMLGLITLSGRVLVDWGVFGPLLRVQDHGSVVAHEVAHQWWGHLVGWRGYRDQWISEAMANYATLLWARHHGLTPAVGPVTGWQQELTATIADGRAIESLGPLVLGERLFSSRSQDAYQAIVYRKGPLVLEMLARKFGEQDFLRALRALVTAAAGRAISTGEFLSLLEGITATDLDGFARQFIFGTGLPEIYYDYAFERNGKGGWRVRVDAVQEMPARARYAVVPMARSPSSGGASDTRLDVARGRVEGPANIDSSELVVPFQILLANDPAAAESAAWRRRDETPTSLRRDMLIGRLVISGRHTELTFEIKNRPVKLWLDRDRQIFGRFFDRRKHPKRMLLQQAAKLSAGGQRQAAEEALRRALATHSPLASTDYLLDSHIHLRLASVLMDSGRDTEAALSLDLARDAFAQGREALPSSEVRRFARAFEVSEARMEVRRGAYQAAYQRLHGDLLDPQDATSTEGYLLLAIAAHATGHQSELEAALEIARRRGADVSRLRSRSIASMTRARTLYSFQSKSLKTFRSRPASPVRHIGYSESGNTSKPANFSGSRIRIPASANISAAFSLRLLSL